MPETTLPEGWYRDPSLPATRRWWDGTAWTDHVRPDEDAALGLGALRRSTPAASVSSAEAPAVSEATTFAVPSELEGTKPVSSVGSAAVGGSWRTDTPPWAASSVAAPSVEGSFAAPSSVADLESVDYAPMERSWAPSATAAPARRTPQATGTAGAWLLALSPVLTLLLAAGVGALVLSDPLSPVAAIAAWVASGLTLAWLVLAVVADFRRLGALGYASRPSVLWIILGPLPYLISRTVHVHRATGRGSAPLWVYLGVSVLVGAGTVLLMLAFVPGLLSPLSLPGS
ncbi:MAG: DUF2510 domain-containing protein [Microcella pacifica]|uniref:DUF2510 domain-containing protein n=1 Tax=Microcella TaxID=337004 RepID=UPI001C54C8B4|nr:DUF2510 domain-containing protein [Microcella indica]